MMEAEIRTRPSRGNVTELKREEPMKTMLVRSEIKLSVPAGERHVKAARWGAERLAADKAAIRIETDGNWILTTFPIPKARQIDVCDRIFKSMAMQMEDYEDQTLVFPKTEAERRRAQRKLARAKERRRQARQNPPKP